jgi:hypothetical protein
VDERVDPCSSIVITGAVGHRSAFLSLNACVERSSMHCAMMALGCCVLASHEHYNMATVEQFRLIRLQTSWSQAHALAVDEAIKVCVRYFCTLHDT